jgi:hypothetical protein
VIVGKADGAIKLNHTSPPGVPAQVLVTAGLEIVAPDKLLVVFTHAVPVDKLIALLQLSFLGVCCKVKSNLYLLEFPVGAVVT